MTTSYTPNHYKYMLAVGKMNLKAQSSNLTITFDNVAKQLTRAAGDFEADGFEVGDIIYTTSALNDNGGPLYVTGTAALALDVVLLDGTAATLSNTAIANTTVGTYLLKCMLMRDGFTFDIDTRAQLKNIQVSLSGLTLTATSNGAAPGAGTFTRSAGSFVTDGIVVGNQVTIGALHAAVNGVYTVTAIDTETNPNDRITVAEAVASDQTGDGDETVVSDDEYTGGGYAGAVLSGVASLTEDDTNNYLNATFSPIVFTASGGTIDNCPGMLIYNQASDATEQFVVGYIAFSSAASVLDTETITVSGTTIRIA